MNKHLLVTIVANEYMPEDQARIFLRLICDFMGPVAEKWGAGLDVTLQVEEPPEPDTGKGGT